MRAQSYYQRHSTATLGKEQGETAGLLKTEAKQRDTPGEKGYGRPLVRRSTITTGRLSHLYTGQFFWVFVFLPAKILVSFFTSDLSWDSPLVCTHPSAEMDLQVEAPGRSKAHYGLAFSWDFSPTRSCSGHVQCFPCPKRGVGGGEI